MDSSESVIGRWLRSRGCRDKVIISTKGGHPQLDDMSSSRLDPESLRCDLNRSLDCLGSDYADIYFLHRDDERIPVSEIMPILNEFVQSGKVHLSELPTGLRTVSKRLTNTRRLTVWSLSG